MEYSKLPFGLVPVDNIRKSGRPESLEIWDSAGRCITSFCEADESFSGVSRGDMERAEFIVEACNAHDKLKAKAGLFDELLFVSQWINNFISTASDGGDAWCAVRNQDGASDWAKRLGKVVLDSKALESPTKEKADSDVEAGS